MLRQCVSSSTMWTTAGAGETSIDKWNVEFRWNYYECSKKQIEKILILIYYVNNPRPTGWHNREKNDMEVVAFQCVAAQSVNERDVFLLYQQLNSFVHQDTGRRQFVERDGYWRWRKQSKLNDDTLLSNKERSWTRKTCNILRNFWICWRNFFYEFMEIWMRMHIWLTQIFSFCYFLLVFFLFGVVCIIRVQNVMSLGRAPFFWGGRCADYSSVTSKRMCHLSFPLCIIAYPYVDHL